MSVSTREARAALGGRSLDIRNLEHDPRTAQLGLEGADTDGDGRVDGEELDRLVATLDRMDGRRDGRIGGRPGARRSAARSTAQRALQAVAEAAGADALAAAAAEGLDLRTAVTFVGVTHSSLGEARGLRERGVPVELVRDVGTAEPDQGWGPGGPVPLGTEAQRRRFVHGLDLPPPVARDVAAVLAGTSSRGRGEIAALARQWAGAYHGQPIPERLVLSGHGDGEVVFETNGDRIARADVLALARAMPGAAKHLRHVHVAACQHGYEPRTEPYFDAFPNLRSVWGYAGFAPSGATARAHQARWERATRSDTDRAAVHAALAQGTRRAVAVAVHRRGEAWEGPPVEPLPDLGARARAGAADFGRLFRGELVVTRPGEGFGADHYQTLQSLTAHHDFADQSDDYRAFWTQRREQTLRLRFFTSHVAPTFERVHGPRLDRAYAALDLARPDFGSLTRAETLAAVARFDAAFRDAGAPSELRAARDLLVEGLVQLDPARIPVEWL
ncbi:MAG: hypothetical protein CMN30_24950 [Sandaracinus sp.]|nr:hypothetical protein [Sandaracinus sp.]